MPRAHRTERHPRVQKTAVVCFTVTDMPESIAMMTAIFRAIADIESGKLTDIRECGRRLEAAMAQLDRATLQRGAPPHKRAPKLRGAGDAEPKGRTPRRKGP